MGWLGIVITVIIACFGLVVLVGPPYLPTLDKQMITALDMLDLKPGQTMLELGCGDGKVLVAAAQRGWKVVGYELNPILVLICYARTVRYRKQVRVVWGDFWNTKRWPAAEGIFGFILPKYMAKLDRRIISWQTRPLRLASFAFKIPDKKVAREQNGVFLYEYKAPKS